MHDCITLKLDLPELRVIGQHHEPMGLVVEVEYALDAGRCPRCHRTSTKIHDRRPQRKRDRPLHGQLLFIVLWRRRFRCLWCRSGSGRAVTFSEPNPVWGIGHRGRARRTTCRLRTQVATEAAHQTVKRVAQVYGVSERFVRTCFATQASQVLATQRAQRPPARVIGIDEFATKRGYRYETIVCDLEAPCVLEVVAGRDAAAVQPCLEQIVDAEQVHVVVMDMNEGYRQIVQLCLPQAYIVVDRFHAVQRVGRALDQVRQRLQSRADTLHKDLLYRRRYTLLQDPHAWTSWQQAEVETLLAALPDLQHAWECLSAFQAWYQASDRTQAEQQLVLWEQHLRATRLKEYQALFARGSLLGSWREELLNYFDHRVTNAYVEGKHTRTKQFIRQAYGYRNRNNLRLRILLPAA